jgi:hypothetical protein
MRGQVREWPAATAAGVNVRAKNSGWGIHVDADCHMRRRRAGRGVGVFALRSRARQGEVLEVYRIGNGQRHGGSTATIHLQGFSTGGTYAVTKKGNVATGTTANGTKCTCRLS